MIQKITIAFLALFAVFSNAFAENLTLNDFTEKNSGLNSELTFNMFPQYPSSREEVLVKLTSYYFNINLSEVVVYLNGKEYKKQIGLKEFKFITANPGENNLLQILVRDPNGKIHTKKVDFTSENVGIVYEVVDPFVPFNYKGKSTVVANSKVNIFAFPDFVSDGGKKIDKKSLVYTWYKNGDVDGSASGFGKYKYTIDRLTAAPDDLYIEVLVTDISRQKIAKNEIYFKPIFTKVDFYAENQTLPFTFKNVSKDGVLESSEKNIVVRAVPYFMNNDKAESLEYTWKINGKNYIHKKGDSEDRLLFVNDTDNNETIIDIFFQLKNDYRILQTAYTNLKLILKSDNQNGIINQQYFNEGSNSDQNSSGLSDFFGL